MKTRHSRGHRQARRTARAPGFYGTIVAGCAIMIRLAVLSKRQLRTTGKVSAIIRVTAIGSCIFYAWNSAGHVLASAAGILLGLADPVRIAAGRYSIQ